MSLPLGRTKSLILLSGIALAAGLGGWCIGSQGGREGELAPGDDGGRTGRSAADDDPPAEVVTHEDLIRGAWVTRVGAFSFHDGRFRARWRKAGQDADDRWEAGLYGFSGGQLLTKSLDGTVLIIKAEFGLDEHQVPTMSWKSQVFDTRTRRYVPMELDFVLASRDRKVAMPTPEAEHMAETFKPPYKLGFDPLFDKQAYAELNPYEMVSAGVLERMERGDHSGSAGMAFIAGQVGVLGRQEMIQHADRHETLRSLDLIEDIPYDPEPLHKPAKPPRRP